MPVFDTPEPISVVIAPIVGDVRVIASDRTDTVVQVSPSDPATEADVTAAEQTRVEFAHGRLLVKAPKRKHYSLFGTGGSIDVTIELPTGSGVQSEAAMGDFRGEGGLGECRVKTSTGHIWLDRTGPLHLSTSLGDVTVDHVAGDAVVTGSGDIRIGEVAGTAEIKNLNGNSWVGEVGGELRCTSANGDIAVERAHAAVRARTASGSIRVDEAVRGSIALDTAFGTLEVGVRAGTAALLDVRSGFGQVRNSLEASAGPEPSDETVDVRARSSYGDIVIRRA